MKDLMYLVLLLSASRFFYIQGIKDTDYDRQLANLRLKQCLEVITK